MLIDTLFLDRPTDKKKGKVKARNSYIALLPSWVQNKSVVLIIAYCDVYNYSFNQSWKVKYNLDEVSVR